MCKLLLDLVDSEYLTAVPVLGNTHMWIHLILTIAQKVNIAILNIGKGDWVSAKVRDLLKAI